MLIFLALVFDDLQWITMQKCEFSLKQITNKEIKKIFATTGVP